MFNRPGIADPGMGGPMKPKQDNSQLFSQYMARLQQQAGQLQQGGNPQLAKQLPTQPIQRPNRPAVMPGPLQPTPPQRPGIIPGPTDPSRPHIQNLPFNPQQGQPGIQNLPFNPQQGQPGIQNLPMQMNQQPQAQPGAFQNHPHAQQHQQQAQAQQMASGAQRFIQAALQQGHDPNTVMNFVKSKMGGQFAEF